MTHLLIQDAAKKIDEGRVDEATPIVAMAKAEGVEFSLAAADFAMKTFGAEGYSNKVDLGQRVIDLMGLRIADGTTDVLRSEVVRKVYGNDFWEMAITGGMPRRPAMMASAFAPARAAAYQWPDPETIISNLQRQDQNQSPLAIQEQFDPLIRPEGGGACATATAFNLIQIIRSYRSPSFLLNPHAVIADAFLQMPELLDGRVTNEQFEKLLAYLKKHLARVDFDFSVKAAPKDLAQIETAKPNELQVYIYRVYEADGSLVGRHFVVLKKKSDDVIVVQDAYNPFKNYEYRLQPTTGEETDKGFIRLVRPGVTTPSHGRSFYLDAIGTAYLRL